MTVEITQSKGENYTWATANFAWSDASGRKSWSESHVYEYLISASESIGLSDRATKAATLALLSGFSIADKREGVNISKRVFESIGFLELYRDTINYILALYESFSVSEQSAHEASFVRKFAESMGVSDLPSTAITKRIEEAMSIADQESTKTAFKRAFSESFSTYDAVMKSAIKAFKETVSVSDKHANRLTKRELESLVIEEMLSQEAKFKRAFDEALSVYESGQEKSVTARYAESISVTDIATKSVLVGIHESFALSDSFAKSIMFYRVFAENLLVSESEINKLIGLNFSEDLIVDDEASKHFVANFSESMAFADALARVVEFRRQIEEGFSVEEAVKKASRISIKEIVAVVDDLVRKPNAVISDLIVEPGGDLTEEVFDELVRRGSHAGYSDFVNFVTGDYTFKDALVRIALKSLKIERPGVNELSVDVDLPDVLDSGETTIPASDTFIPFNRSFYIIPEVSITLRGGTVVAIPDLVSSSKTGFTVRLKDPTTGAPVAGSITWAARGY